MPSNAYFEDRFSLDRIEHSELVQHLKQNEPVLLWNETVFALAVNAKDDDVLAKIQYLKTRPDGGERGAQQPVAWITPFGTLDRVIDKHYITHEGIRNFVSDPDEMTRRLGALAFIRAKADLAAKERENIPDAIIPPEPGTQVQIWSPTRNLYCSRFVRVAEIAGIMVAMTSANIHGEPEITTLQDANAFACHTNQTLLVVEQGYKNQHVEQRAPNGRKIIGSYPVISIDKERITLLRGGFVEPDLVADILYDLPFGVANSSQYKLPAYPENVISRDDLPVSVRSAKGEQLSRGILELFLGTAPE